jgi:hypothetical protein
MFDMEKCEYVMMGLVGEIQYSFIKREGSILMPTLGCVDMKSAIAFFKKIDPKVVSVISFNNGCPDVKYEKKGEKWVAFSCRAQSYFTYGKGNTRKPTANTALNTGMTPETHHL